MWIATSLFILGLTPALLSPPKLQGLSTHIQTETYPSSVNQASQNILGSQDISQCRVVDTNGDSIVNLIDYLGLAQNFFSSNQLYDFNNSGSVDLADYLLFANYFLQTCSEDPDTTPSPSPEADLEVVSGPTPTEKIRVIEEISLPANEIMKGDYASPVVTHNGEIYMTYVDPNFITKIAKKDRNGNITTSIVDTENNGKTDSDLYHVISSIALDKNGFIHVTGNMHGTPYYFRNRNRDDFPYKDYTWQYFVSKRPYDIREFEFVGDEDQVPDDLAKECWYRWPVEEVSARVPTACNVTYPFFATDRNGELYLGYRERVQFNQSSHRGNMGSDVSKYNAATKTWQQLGGKDYPKDYFNRDHMQMSTLFWTPKRTEDSIHYQPFKPRIIFDRNNRMHVLTGMQRYSNTTSGGELNAITDVVYAYSDDGGQTFKKASGNRYNQLPITDISGDIVYSEPDNIPGRMHNYTALAVSPEGQPYVTLTNTVSWQVLWRTFENNRWQVPTNDSTPPSGYPGHFVIDDRGILSMFQGNTINRSYDYGQTWQSYSIDLGDSSATVLLDIRHTQVTGDLRFLLMESQGDNWLAKVKTVSFD